MMKKVIVILAIVLAPVMSFGQSMFDKYEDMEGVTSMVVNQKMFSMLASMDISVDDPESQEYIDMVKKITNFKVMTTGDEGISAKMKADVNSYLKGSRLDELMRIKDGDQTVKFYVREGKNENYVKELLMYVTGLKEMTKDSDITINGKKREIETVVLSLTGDIDLRQVSKIAQKMNIEGGKHLEKVNDKKNK